MSMEDTIRSWKSDEEALEPSPVGRELNEQELLEVVGSSFIINHCGGKSCSLSCSGTCPLTN